jgi:predicted Zn-dependent protease
MAHRTLTELEPSLQRTERLYIALGIKVFGALLLLVLLGWGGHELFQRVREERAMKQVRAAVEKGDKRWAAIGARRVYELNPRNVEVCRILAELSESQGDLAAVDWRREVTLLQPDSVEDGIAFARTALRFRQPGTAERALQRIADKAASIPAFHEVMAQVAISRKDPTAAFSHLQEAVRLAPENKLYQLNRAVFQLQSSSAEERLQATRLLETFMEDEKLRLAAARALRDYAAQRRDGPALLSIASYVYSYPEAELQDRIYYVQLLRLFQHPDFAPELTRLQQEAVTDPAKLYDVLHWMRSDGLALLALDWVKRLPLHLTSLTPVPQAVANSYVAVNDWDGLREWCKKAQWGPMDFMRHAYLALVARKQEQTVESRAAWAAAMKAVGSDAEKISTLQQETANWGWREESAELLWMLTKDAARQHAAFAALYEHYTATGQTGDLLRVATRLLELRPDDVTLMNNFAQLALLLNVDTTRAQDLAQRVFTRDPKNPIFASTCAYALFVKGKPKQALEIMNALAADDLRQPSIAAYYGIILAGTGEKERAREFLALAADAKLLPEERTLLNKAREQAML